MFRYKCTTFRKHNTPNLKPTANDKLLSTKLHSLQWATLLMSITYEKYNLYTFLRYD
jgi:hypothetical protein